MKLENLEVVQVDQDDLTDDIQEAVTNAIREAGTVNLPWHVWFRMVIAGRFHFLGIHQWAKLRVMDPASKRLLDTGSWACLVCQRVHR